VKLTLHRFALPLAHTFTISRGSIDTRGSLIVELSDGGQTGLGEVTENSYYGQTLESMSAAVEGVRTLVESFDLSSGSPEQLYSELFVALGADMFPLCAIDEAAHDLHARLQGLPLRTLWARQGQFDLPPEAGGNSSASLPDSSYTIGIASPDEMVARLKERPGWSVYKIKLGTKEDVEIVRRLREHTDAVFRVDANCAWAVEEAIENSHALAKLNVEFIEQPLPAGAPDEDHRLVFEQSALPVVADESCLVAPQVEKCHGLFHGVNVKLSKCGGLTPALGMLRRAKELGLRTMLGCMIESSVGISAAAQLLPLLDYADLDGAVLLREDPARGVDIEKGLVAFSDWPGTGAELVPEIADRLRVS
jgi:L-alanine-DL-glutamate epimerase-like enolase superfamily enzyme